jgi:hypothetical protein
MMMIVHIKHLKGSCWLLPPETDLVGHPCYVTSTDNTASLNNLCNNRYNTKFNYERGCGKSRHALRFRRCRPTHSLGRSTSHSSRCMCASQLQWFQRSVETTYYTVSGHCSCRPTNIRFSFKGVFKWLLSVLSVVVDHKERKIYLNKCRP